MINYIIEPTRWNFWVLLLTIISEVIVKNKTQKVHLVCSIIQFPQGATKFLDLYRNWEFIVFYTTDYRASLSIARWIQSLYPVSLRTVLIVPSHIHLSYQSGLFHLHFLTKILYVFSSPQYVLQTPPNLSALNFSPAQSFVFNTNHEAPNYAVFSRYLLLPTFQAQTSPSALNSRNRQQIFF